MQALEQLQIALSNVLRRKRSDLLGLQQKMEAALRGKDSPPHGLGESITVTQKEIQILEAALEVAMKGGD